MDRRNRPPVERRALVLALAITAACALAAAVGLWGARPAHGDALLPLPGPAPRARSATPADLAKQNTSCEGCHVEIAAEWRGSLHQQAWHDPVFQKAYAIEPVAFCRGCHAPESDAAKEPTAEARDLGIGCVTCHVQGEHVVGKSTLAGTAKGHPVKGDARLGTTQACAACHQFDFPRSPGLAMQDTLTEHKASKYASFECQSCHMAPVTKDGKSHRSHAFAVITDPEMIRKAASVTAARATTHKVDVTIAAAAVGHAFPTGDMFRRLEVRAEAFDAEGKRVAAAQPVHLGRSFGDHGVRPGDPGFRRVEVADTRVPPPGAGPARVVELEFPVSVAGAEVRWVVAYQRMDHAMAASFGVEQARDEVTVASGALARPDAAK